MRLESQATDTPRYRESGDGGLLVELGDRIDWTLNARTRRLALLLERRALPGVVEIVPAYCSFLILFEPETLDLERLKAEIDDLFPGLDDSGEKEPEASGQVVEIPVCYGGDFGPDLASVAQHNGLSPEEVIRIHSSGTYPVYMLGFAPGFPYLGGLDERIATPRLDTPRSHVPAGSVGIAGSQTGIYPLASPGGWRLIGRTPLTLFDSTAEDPVPYYRPGDSLRFVAVSQEEFNRLLRERDHG
ncbi:MAG: 5-oxoprolinase subunit PxpB [Desulfohalobiaceae bacterium]|nr:5-oxoprolinase subunit PxpB [Desulfohalobiaceae bacterium]